MVIDSTQLIALGVALLVMLAGIADVARIDRELFTATGRKRWHWLLLIICFGPLAVLLYAAAVRPQVLHPERYADEPDDGQHRLVPSGGPTTGDLDA